ncbi:protein E6-like [Phaseolus vulgaris]|uniref:Protein E6 n=1 Tax=Phaseolus vulgaris TaxID=3885 RepID=V7CMJ7_PHAVU|nr:hypothetical protein PHAVU_002G232100g [Phaseolus vulgaris]ESW31359.1 hypothetical protein PHAVU_002G232100g [Phaseolus vulgaris]
MKLGQPKLLISFSLSHSPMAPISKLIPFLFLTTLLFSLQLHARESQFFSKVTPLNNLKQTEITNNEASLNKPEQQQPVFLPQTENSYGLYGHETGLHPPSTTTTNAAPYTTPTTFQPYKTTTTEEDNNNNNFHSFNSKDAFGKQNDFSDTKFTEGGYSSKENQNNNYFYNNNDAFGKQNELSDSKYSEGGYNSKENQNNNYYYNSKDDFGKQNELSDTKYAEGGYKSMENQNNNDNAANERYYSNNNDNAANERYYYNSNKDNANNRYYKTKAVNNNYNSERQGLSDTRFVEGGKYFYDVNSEKYNNPTQYGGSSRGVSSENWSNNRGYFGNNNVNSYENKNSMEGYQNQEQFEDDQEDFEP